MSKVRIYHNPKCRKSRETLQLLESNNQEFEIVEYLKDSPKVKDIQDLLKKLGIPASQLVRKGEYKKLGLTASHSESGLVKQMAKFPILIERPIVVKGAKAKIGRPPENVLSIL